jgi:hypothetical protein
MQDTSGAGGDFRSPGGGGVHLGAHGLVLVGALALAVEWRVVQVNGLAGDVQRDAGTERVRLAVLRLDPQAALAQDQVVDHGVGVALVQVDETRQRAVHRGVIAPGDPNGLVHGAARWGCRRAGVGCAGGPEAVGRRGRAPHDCRRAYNSGPPGSLQTPDQSAHGGARPAFGTTSRASLVCKIAHLAPMIGVPPSSIGLPRSLNRLPAEPQPASGGASTGTRRRPRVRPSSLARRPVEHPGAPVARRQAPVGRPRCELPGSTGARGNRRVPSVERSPALGGASWSLLKKFIGRPGVMTEPAHPLFVR